MKRSMLCFALIIAMLCPALFSCGSSNNMTFTSVDEMANYLNGTFENENRLYMIESGKITAIDKTKAFSTSESYLSKISSALPESVEIDKLTLTQVLSYADGCTEGDISYNNKKGTITFNDETLSVDLQGNLVDKSSNVCKWVSQECTTGTDLMLAQYDEFMTALVEYYAENIGVNIVGTWKYKFAANVETNERITPDDSAHTGNGLYRVEYVTSMRFDEDGTGEIDWGYGYYSRSNAIVWEKAKGTDGLTGYKITFKNATNDVKPYFVYCMFTDGEFYLASSDTRTYSVHNKDSEYLYYEKD